ncbi:hypothetical protein AMAG_00427 [Allomyces macrogynus ATCC 38327]|uniref:C2H2-type domain-containing protein n=1 Tax=Allomyces macrogynus (strain ATCC 38327) TaxID=578462 RepID=A0A0L0RVZ0_ALLM3|nr:hypothetical protein AMAG_00427 [Allomyces macrogynus ATCC 38327]|eukprot:KNE54453.1 hypothetical protein AMAG_00427 [Allomyces macrogynus ATCC 38327]
MNTAGGRRDGFPAHGNEYAMSTTAIASTSSNTTAIPALHEPLAPPPPPALLLPKSTVDNPLPPLTPTVLETFPATTAGGSVPEWSGASTLAASMPMTSGPFYQHSGSSYYDQGHGGHGYGYAQDHGHGGHPFHGPTMNVITSVPPPLPVYSSYEQQQHRQQQHHYQSGPSTTHSDMTRTNEYAMAMPPAQSSHMGDAYSFPVMAPAAEGSYGASDASTAFHAPPPLPPPVGQDASYAYDHGPVYSNTYGGAGDQHLYQANGAMPPVSTMGNVSAMSMSHAHPYLYNGLDSTSFSLPTSTTGTPTAHPVQLHGPAANTTTVEMLSTTNTSLVASPAQITPVDVTGSPRTTHHDASVAASAMVSRFRAHDPPLPLPSASPSLGPHSLYPNETPVSSAPASLPPAPSAPSLDIYPAPEHDSMLLSAHRDSPLLLPTTMSAATTSTVASGSLLALPDLATAAAPDLSSSTDLAPPTTTMAASVPTSLPTPPSSFSLAPTDPVAAVSPNLLGLHRRCYSLSSVPSPLPHVVPSHDEQNESMPSPAISPSDLSGATATSAAPAAYSAISTLPPSTSARIFDYSSSPPIKRPRSMSASVVLGNAADARPAGGRMWQALRADGIDRVPEEDHAEPTASDSPLVGAPSTPIVPGSLHVSPLIVTGGNIAAPGTSGPLKRKRGLSTPFPFANAPTSDPTAPAQPLPAPPPSSSATTTPFAPVPLPMGTADSVPPPPSAMAGGPMAPAPLPMQMTMPLGYAPMTTPPVAPVTLPFPHPGTPAAAAAAYAMPPPPPSLAPLAHAHAHAHPHPHPAYYYPPPAPHHHPHAHSHHPAPGGTAPLPLLAYGPNGYVELPPAPAVHDPTPETAKPFVCTFAPCTARFSRNHDLKRHERIHTGEKKWQCVECGRAFGRRDALVRHTSAPGGKCKAMFGKRRAGKQSPGMTGSGASGEKGEAKTGKQEGGQRNESSDESGDGDRPPPAKKVHLDPSAETSAAAIVATSAQSTTVPVTTTAANSLRNMLQTAPVASRATAPSTTAAAAFPVPIAPMPTAPLATPMTTSTPFLSLPMHSTSTTVPVAIVPAPAPMSFPSNATARNTTTTTTP